MSWRNVRSTGWVSAAALLLAATPSFGAGFGIFEQGSKAMGMAGAFTAQADDPSMLFHNAGGLAFVEESAISGGFTWIKGAKAEFEGDNPFPGDDARAEQELLSEFPPHLYYVAPLAGRWKWGIGVTAPFGLVTEWKNENTFPGRFLSTKAALETVDINPTLGWQVTDRFGVGFGVIARASTVELRRHAGAVNPFTQTVVDVARLELEGDMSYGYGFNVGLLHKVTPAFSWGLSYRSQIDVDYEGDARLTQINTGNAQFDAIIRSRLPFDTNLPVETAIAFPDMASLGLAYAITPRLLVEADVNWTGWSSFDSVEIDFTGNSSANSLPDSEIPQGWDDAMNYRLGVRWGDDVGQWRFGYVYDETPQPEESVSPLLPDANRNGITIGFGHNGAGLNWDIAFMYLKFDERSRHKSFAGEPDYFGEYNQTAYLLGITLGWQ